MSKTKLKKSATKLHTHTVVFSADTSDEDCVILAFIGHTTKAIAHQTGLTEGQVHYRIAKAGLVGERANYRSGSSDVSRLVLRSVIDKVATKVRTEVAPKFAAYAEGRRNWR